MVTRILSDGDGYISYYDLKSWLKSTRNRAEQVEEEAEEEEKERRSRYQITQNMRESSRAAFGRKQRAHVSP